MLQDRKYADEFDGGTTTAIRPTRSTRQAIVEAAHSLLMERGNAGVKVRSVASRVGVTTGALYGYFATREDLVSAAYGYELALSIASFHENDAAERAHPFRSDRRGSETANALSPEGRTSRIAWLSAMLRARHDQQLAKAIELEQQNLLKVLADRVREAQELGHVDSRLDPLAVAAVTFGSSLGISAMWPLFEGIEGFAEKVADVWCSTRLDTYSSSIDERDAAAGPAPEPLTRVGGESQGGTAPTAESVAMV
jgi:AcrR family transcriptional regulator